MTGFHGSDRIAHLKGNKEETFRLKTASAVAFQMRRQVRTVKPETECPKNGENGLFNWLYKPFLSFHHMVSSDSDSCPYAYCKP